MRDIVPRQGWDGEIGPGNKGREEKQTGQAPEGNKITSDACLLWTAGNRLTEFRRSP